MSHKRWFFSFQNKILLTYMAVVFIPITIGFSIFTIKLVKEEQHRYVALLSQLNDQVARNSEVIIKNVSRNTSLHDIDALMLDILTKERYTTEAQYYKDLEYMKKNIRHSIRLNPYITGVTYVGMSNKVYDNTGEHEEYMSKSMEFMSQARLSKTKSYISPMYTARINRQDINTITLTKMLINPYTQMQAGYVNINVDFDQIYDAFKREEIPSEASQFFVFQNSKIIYDSVKESRNILEQDINLIEEYLNRKSDAGNDYSYFEVQLNKGKYLMVAEKVEMFDHYIVHYVPLTFIKQNILSSIVFYMSSTIIMCIIAGIVGYLFSIKMSKPINKLLAGMKRMENGYFEPVEEKERNDEIGLLVGGFNKMACKLDESIKKEYLTQIKQKKFQIKMLQAQINPHFVYNTLNLISSIAQLEDISSITGISSNLAKMLYYNLKGKDIVRLSDEIEQIRRYMEIQKMRFPNKFTDIYCIEDQLEEFTIMKFILQPLVENSVYHGLEKKVGTGTITINVTRVKNSICIELKDNGIGIDKPTLHHLRERMAESSDEYLLGEKLENVGLLNVHYRIRNYYGSNYGISIESEINSGTAIIITIPAIPEGGRLNESTGC